MSQSRQRQKKPKYSFFVASFGYNIAITIILKQMGILSYFQDIRTPSSIDLIDGRPITVDGTESKRPFLQDFIPEKTLMIDDANEIIQDLKKIKVHKFHVHQVHRKIGGIGEKDMQEIIDFLEKNKQIDTIVFDADYTLFSKHITSELDKALGQDEQQDAQHAAKKAVIINKKIQQNMTKCKVSQDTLRCEVLSPAAFAIIQWCEDNGGIKKRNWQAQSQRRPSQQKQQDKYGGAAGAIRLRRITRSHACAAGFGH
jgi:hypothetical protein